MSIMKAALTASFLLMATTAFGLPWHSRDAQAIASR